ncbi:MAG: MATE family efflux transporter [Gemmatimonadales bacterium]|nr:MATE family efflux transporter [Gemmatimonadales bacterium]
MHPSPESIALTPAPTTSGGVWRDLRDALRGTQHDYTRGPLGRAIFLLAVPMVVEMAMESLFAVVDVFFVGRLGSAAVATVGLTESLMIVIYTIAFGLSIGATAVVSRRIGEKDKEGAARAAVQVLALGALISAVLGIAGAVYARELLQLMGADAEVLATGTGYARVLLGGSSTVFLLFLINAVFRGAGDPAVAMRVLILGNSINIVMDPTLIFGLGPFPEMGLTGAAVASTVGRGIGFLFALRLLTKGSGHLAVKRRHLSLEPATMWRIASLSGSGTFQVALGSMSWIGLVRVISGFGSVAMAGYTIAIRVVLFALMPAFGIGAAAATMVGQSLGAKLPDRAEASVWAAARYNAVFLGLTGLGFFIFAPWIVGWFTADPAVVRVAAYGLRAIAVGFPLFALGMVLEQSFNGAGDTWTPTWINLFVFWLVQIPLAWVLAYRMGFDERGVFIAVSAAYSLLALVSAVLFKRGRWKLKHV